MRTFHFIYFILIGQIIAFIPQLLLSKIEGNYVQIYSNYYIQSTREIDWKCINISIDFDDQKTTILQANLRIQNAKTDDDKLKAKNDLKEIYDTIYARYPAVGGIGGLGQKPAGAPTTGAPASGNTRMKFDAKGNPIP